MQRTQYSNDRNMLHTHEWKLHGIVPCSIAGRVGMTPRANWQAVLHDIVLEEYDAMLSQPVDADYGITDEVSEDLSCWPRDVEADTIYMEELVVFDGTTVQYP